MPAVTATFRDGRSVAFNDGTVSGDPLVLLELADPPAASAQVRPDGPEVPTGEWRTDAWSFVAACLSLEDTAHIAIADLPPLPGIDVPAGAD